MLLLTLARMLICVLILVLFWFTVALPDYCSMGMWLSFEGFIGAYPNEDGSGDHIMVVKFLEYKI